MKIRWSLARNFLIVFAFAITHVFLVDKFHEKSLFFSHLSETERELTFTTEMGFYYSFFKQIINRVPFHELLNDTRTEYPRALNALQRFNIYPEVILGYTYNFLVQWNMIPAAKCYTVNRLADDTYFTKTGTFSVSNQVSNCVGPRQPSVFYTRVVFLLAGLVPACLAASSILLSSGDWLFAPSLVCFTFLALLQDCTRVQWTPPLREHFSYPFFLLQQLFLLKLLRMSETDRNQSTWLYQVLFGVAQLAFQLPWQLSQFILSLQLLALLPVHLISKYNPNVLRSILNIHLVTLFFSFVLQFGNRLLLTSVYLPCLLTVFLMVRFYPRTRPEQAPMISLAKGGLVASTLLGILLVLQKRFLAEESDDGGHIFDILKVKLLGPEWRTFHTQLYLCSAEFDFLPWDVIMKLCWPAPVIPVAVMASLRCLKEGKPGQLFMVFLTAAFSGLGLLVMRMRLFFLPQLILMMATLWPVTNLRTPKKLFIKALQVFLVAYLTHFMYQSVSSKLAGDDGEFQDVTQEALFGWLKQFGREAMALEDREKPLVLAGPMPTMAAARLQLLGHNFATINHPHYEDARLRNTTVLVYTAYSRLPIKQIWQILSEQLQADLLIFEAPWCMHKNKRSTDCLIADLYKFVWPGLTSETDSSSAGTLCRLLRVGQPYKGLTVESEPYFTELFTDYSRFRVLLRVNKL